MNSKLNILLGTVSLMATGGALAQRPNVIYIFPDQFRNHAMGFWNEQGFREHVNFTADPVQTPVLNKLARESVVLSRAVSNCPLSSPHRGMLLTGTYPQVSGVPMNCNSTRPYSSLDQNLDAVGDVFKRAGYDCAYLGKLHLDFPTPNDPDRPGRYVEDQTPVWDAFTPVERRHGFDYWYSYGTFDEHKRPHYWDSKNVRHEIREWSPKHEADVAIDYMRNRNGERDNSRPFFMMISMNPPHSPYSSLDDCMEEDYNLYKDMPVDKLLVRENADRTMSKTRNASYYFASVTGVDREVGRILDELKRLGLDDNTIVVFSSDHGETMCSQGTPDPKNSPYAESLNVPFLVRYPGRLAPRVDSLLISTPDIMPTLLGLCSLSDKIPSTVQGRDLSPLFRGEKSNVVAPEVALYLRNLDGPKDVNGIAKGYVPVARGIKTAQYTFVLTVDPKTMSLKTTQLFDDRADPYQLRNIPLNSDPALKSQLLRALAAELKRTNDPWYVSKVLKDILPY